MLTLNIIYGNMSVRTETAESRRISANTMCAYKFDVTIECLLWLTGAKNGCFNSTDYDFCKMARPLYCKTNRIKQIPFG